MMLKVRNRKDNTIILGYYGIGKSTVASTSDTVYDWTYDLMQPKLSELEYGLENYDVILCDPNCLYLLQQQGLKFHIVVPNYDRLGEFKANMRKRHQEHKGTGHESFIRSIEKKWHSELEELRETQCLSLTVLNNGQYLADVIDKIV